MIDTVLRNWADSSLAPCFRCHQQWSARKAAEREFPQWVVPQLLRALKQRGICGLYEHQWQTLEAVHRGQHPVVATPTASGKTLCYNLPIFNVMVSDPTARALYLFPTKALARDQIENARSLAAALDSPIGLAVYDGDTPPDQRRAARQRARILATNPEMLHSGILPHHPAWSEFLAGLRFVVIDELHTFRGVFGSHLANVIRRLQRVVDFHGGAPQFIATSATIANPLELASGIFGKPATLIKDNGAPSGERHFLVYNPPLIDPALGLRESYIKAVCQITRDLVRASISTLVFCRSRLMVEVLVRQLRELLAEDDALSATAVHDVVRGYRGGYLPDRRRAVEHSLRQGETRVVVATSALELGIDIGSLDAVVMAGWPGSRAATWQRAGRAGRRLKPSLAILVAASDPVDQFVAADPNYLFGHLAEHARINPNNPSILVPHLKCAAHELPFMHHEAFAQQSPIETAEILGCLADAGILHRTTRGYCYTEHPFPANEVHLRGPLDENFLVVQQPEGQVIAEVDYHDAPQVLHDNAIYQLEGAQFEVRQLDHENRKAYVTPCTVDYYTDAMTYTGVRILEQLARQAACCQGEVHVVHRVVGFKKIKLHSAQNVGYGEVSQPERQMHTTAFWINAPADALHDFGGTAAEITEAALGLGYTIHTVAALLLMCDPRDLGRAVGDARSGWFAVSGRRTRGQFSTPANGAAYDPLTIPTIFLFDRYPGGTGLAERLFDQRQTVLQMAYKMINICGCQRGCPACIGPGGRRDAKLLSARLAQLLLNLLSASPGQATANDSTPAASLTVAQTPDSTVGQLWPAARP